MRKKFSLWLTVFMLASLAFSACSEKQESEAVEETIELFAEIAQSKIERFDSIELQALDEETRLLWSSSNESVAVIEDGRVVALATGETVISATDGDVVQEQTVRIVDEGEKPVIDVESLPVLLGSSYEIQANAYFKNRKLEGATFTYSVADTSIATLTGATLTGVAYGETSVTINASWRGQLNVAQKQVPCIVNRNAAIYTDKSEYVVYTMESVMGRTFSTSEQIETIVYLDNERVQDAAVTWEIADESVATIDQNGTVRAVDVGETTAVGKCVSNGVELFTRNIPVKVEKPYVQTQDDYLFDGNEQYARFENALGTNYTVGKAVNVANGAEYPVANGLIDISSFESGEYRFALYENSMAFAAEVNVIIADYIVRTAEDLVTMTSDHFTEYIALANDIENVGVHKPQRGGEYKFLGTFNGLGHTISGMQLTGASGNAGLFSDVGTCTFKNVAIIGTFSANNQGALFYRAAGKGVITVDNVYIHMTVASDACSGSAGVGGLVHTGTALVMSNCIVKVDGLDKNEQTQINCGFVTGRVKSTLVKLNDCYFIGNGKISAEYADETNVYYNMYNITYGNNVFEDETLFAETKGLEFGGFNKYWSLESGIPVFQA
ncbi:MAG: Ig-like domain-containing protein [Clostridia bacterium]|nr:Ig-like domain-containing protein [Clostridia bacterium]